MHALKSVIVGALATTVSATYLNGEALRREVFQVRAASSSASVATVKRPYPTATASANSSNVCDSVLNGLATVLTGLPTPTGDLYSYLKTAATTLTDPCVSLKFLRRSKLHNTPFEDITERHARTSTSQSPPPSPPPSAPTNPP
jgi:hypothetical protein